MATTTVLPAPPPLADLARPALFLDFDGTLVDIAPSPHAIVVPDRLADRLGALGRMLGGRLALVSGRAIADLERHLGSLAICRAGSHGGDCRLADGQQLGVAPAPLPAEAIAALEAFANESGASYEPKDHGGALHFRSSPGVAEAASAVTADLARRHDLEVKSGKSVVELVRPGADKAAAVTAFMREPPFAGAMPVFVGDDLTDEDGMRAAQAQGGFGIIVGERADTRARYRIETVREVHEWLGL